MLTAYLADCLINNMKRMTASSLANLYSSKFDFEEKVSAAVGEFLNGESSFTEIVQTSSLNVAVVYSLSNRSAFNREQVERDRTQDDLRAPHEAQAFDCIANHLARSAG